MARQFIPKHLQGLYRRARKLKWTVTLSGSTHLRWESRDGDAVVTTGLTGRSSADPDYYRLRKAIQTEEKQQS